MYTVRGYRCPNFVGFDSISHVDTKMFSRSDKPALYIDSSVVDELRPEIVQLNARGMSWAAAEPSHRPLDALAVFSCSPDNLSEGMEFVHATRRALVAVPDLDGRLSALFIDAGAVAVWNRLADPRGFPKLVDRLVRDGQRTSKLKPDELQLLSLLSTGSTIREIAEKLFVSERSFYRRLRILYTKLGVHNRNDAVDYYLNVWPKRQPW